MDDDLSLEFESAYQCFVEQGGLDEVKAISEEIERVYLGLNKPQKVICLHGKSILQCSICYFKEFKK
jgi:hypothetical protein